jgi:hypothetical protein
MAKQTINLGTSPTGAGGDTPRSAFTKVQLNFDELYWIDGLARPIEKGGTGATTVAGAVANLGVLALGQINSASAGTHMASGGMPTIAGTTDATNRSGPLIISNGSNSSASACISFIREGLYGLHLGLDTDNQLACGGWSMGQVRRRIYHEGNTSRAADGTLKAI